LNWKGFSEDTTIGGGWIDLRGNNFTRIPSLSQLGFTDLNSAFRGIFNYQLFATHTEKPFQFNTFVTVDNLLA
jgi:hypothetical protein